MSEQPKLTILGTGTKRLTRRKRSQRRGPQRIEVTPAIRQPDLATPIYACQTDIFEGTLLEEKPEELDVHVTKQEKEIILAQARRRIKNLPSLIIENIHYSVMSHEELKEMAVFKVTKTDEEGLHSVNDPRSGVVDNDKVCRTCLADNLNCPGHLGIIELNQHIIHPLFRREVIDILISVCNSCGGLLLPREVIEEKGILKLSGSKRLRALAEASKKVHCRRSKENMAAGATGCIPNPVYKASKVKEVGKIFYSYDGKKGKDNVRTIEEIEQILNAISEEDATLMGFDNKSHPRRFIMKSIPVIPLCARAPVILDGMILKDDLTSMYLDIVRYNQELLREDLNENDRENRIRGLIFSIEHMFDNGDNKYRPGKTKPYLGIKGRIQGKEAIIRNLIQGKRVNYSARTVLGPDPNLKFGQIRIPRAWAPYLTYPETVSPANIGRLTRLLRAGRITHITPARGRFEGRRLKVDERIQNKNLSFGDVVDRWMQNGDYRAFNRQPTLHKQSIMGYEVVLGDPLTIGLHLSYTPPHNADFDGDEGTAHAPQSREALLEMALLMGVKKCIMNAQNNKNIIGVVMDALTGAYLMTQPETFVDPGVFMNIVSFIENTSGRDTLNERLERYHIPLTSGRALFSSILPEDFYYRKGDVLIRDGVLVSGILTKDHLGSTHGSIIQVLMKDYDEETTVNFLTDVYNIMREWLDVRGFSVGLDDCFLSGDDPEKSIEYEVQRAKMLVKSMGWKLKDPLEEERREKQIIAYLNTAKGLGARISKENLPESNAFNVMAKSGSKGSTFNIAQITGILGQQFVRGQRMPNVISDGTRCSPYFPQNSLDPAARGFCVNSFLTGLSPAEMFYHQAGAREGLTDTAIKSVTGDTPIVIIDNGKPKRVNIGDWIDQLLETYGDEIEYHTDRDMELLKIDGVTIPTVDNEGNVTWGDITAVTRHDPGKQLYKVKTLGGRKVTVTESHSLLIWNDVDKEYKRTTTDKIHVGDLMPTTTFLPPPPIITEIIDLRDYLSPYHFIYGSDFLTAKDLVSVYDKSHRCPAGWWEKSNGVLFTLPYTKTYLMHRVVKRSNISYIKPGFVYPYRGRRIETYIPEKLELNRTNGFFIGLYLAEGDCSVESGYVRISNNDPTIIRIVEDWFERFMIKHETSSRINKMGGTSTSTRGFSTVLAEFMYKLVGNGAHNKHIPKEAYTAPDEFIIGLLDGYISGDGTITHNAIEATSCSYELIEGISILTSKLGIFSKMSQRHMKKNNVGTVNIRPIYSMSIRGQWATRFKNLVNISLPEKHERLIKLVGSVSHRNFPEQRDTVKDKIISIEKVDISQYPKVYDLTVPSTLNFGLANGLHVVDTADTGSMHHRVVKALEDVKVYNDGSARNAFGVIFQYTYGEDGFDAAWLETVSTKTGRFASFINMKRLAGSINASYGYTTPGEPDPEEVTPIPPTRVAAPMGEEEFPPVPDLAPGIEMGDVVQFAGGEGIVQQVNGDRVLVEAEGQQPTWVKIGKIELSN